ncbi:MAG TPA: hypothetical protein VFW12_06635 [Candidatus Limnocylindria bacterium]|nr:hypothetical protein [Candidatus Limnocylindria bacterium]
MTATVPGTTMGPMRSYWQFVFAEAAYGAARFASAAEVAAS